MDQETKAAVPDFLNILGVDEEPMGDEASQGDATVQRTRAVQKARRVTAIHNRQRP